MAQAIQNYLFFLLRLLFNVERVAAALIDDIIYLLSKLWHKKRSRLNGSACRSFL